jgi:hypothetical protein
MGLSRSLAWQLRALAGALAVWAMAAGCTGDSFEGGKSTEPDAGACGAEQVACGGHCVDATDPAFGCGACSPCVLEKATAKCVAGACAVEACQSGFADCDQKGGCETNLNTAQSCGQCGLACDAGQVCDQGKCADSCPATKMQCGSSCVDTQNDIAHCGTCNAACKTVPNALSVCSFGECGLACNSGFLNCDGKRETGCEVNSAFDPSHCGACGNACGSGELCKSGQCQLSCGGGASECAGKCVDLQTDEANCGECSKACAAGQNCVGGACKLNCGGGTVECNGACADTSVDPNNCGSCGNACGAGYLCNNGECAAKCAAQVPVELFRDEFADNSKGWILAWPWEIKPAASSSGDTYGFPDPATDASPSSNNGVAGVVIGGNVPIELHDYVFLTSPAVNTGAATSLFLGYSRWLNSDYEPYMKNVVQVFNGSSWITIWQTADSPGITDNSWVKQSFEITQHKNASLRVRFGYKIGSLLVFTVSGWNLDDVVLTAVTCT